MSKHHEGSPLSTISFKKQILFNLNLWVDYILRYNNLLVNNLWFSSPHFPFKK